MLYISLFASIILLFVVNAIARQSKSPIAAVIPVAAAFGLGSVCLTAFFPALALQAALLIAVVIVWRFLQQPPGRFVVWSCGVTMIAYAIVGWFALQDTRRLLAEFPYESMVDRLPPEVPQRAVALTQRQLDALADIEQLIDGPSQYERFQHERRDALKRLHEETVQVFVGRPGFGVMRMRPWGWRLGHGQRSEPPVQQRGTRITIPWSSGELESQVPDVKNDAGDQSLWNVHRSGILDFVNASGFGYFRDRRHVAGFQPHHFRKTPEADQSWTPQTLDLIGLAAHSQPVAYVSENLPRMEELREAPKRPLDEFEAIGLASLRNGEDLFVRDRAEGRRMLGAIRAAKQCIACHGCERGDLLGAFSYTLTRAK